MAKKMTKKEAKDKVKKMLDKAKIKVSAKELRELELAGFALKDFETYGLSIIVYENNDRYCAKELLMFPWQICPEHRHPNVKKQSGKQETFRCRWGEVYLYVDGKPNKKKIKGKVPEYRGEHLKVRKEIILKPGDQFTIPPNTKHWFQAGPQGAIVSEFSSTSRDESDIFTDPAIQRME